MDVKTPFLGGAYSSRSTLLACQRAVNVYLKKTDTGEGKEQGAFFGCPGFDLLVTPQVAEVRGLKAVGSTLYAVVGNGLYSITSSYVHTLVGSLLTTNGLVGIDWNGDSLLIVDGTNGYTYQPSTSTFSQLADFSGGYSIGFVDGYMIMDIPNSGSYKVTGLYTTTIDPLDFATADGSPDNLVAVISHNREVILLGETSKESIADSGNPDFAFERVPGSFSEVGCIARYSVAKTKDVIIWLGRTERGAGAVYISSGYSSQVISTDAIEYAINQWPDMSDARAFVYEDETHTFYVLSSESGNQTFVFDFKTALWHERAYWSDGEFSRWRANCHAYFNGQHIVGDHSNGKIYKLNHNTYTDAGNTRKWLRSWRALPDTENEMDFVRWGQLEIDMEVGVGLDGVGQGTNPQIMLRVSNDGGFTFLPEHVLDIGAIGQKDMRVRCNRMGRSIGSKRVLEISGTDPVKVVLLGARQKASK